MASYPASSSDETMSKGQFASGCATGIVLLGLAVLGAWFVFSKCTGRVSDPLHYHCSYDAQQVVKRHLAFPSTFDEHVSLSNSKARRLATVMGDGDRGWSIHTPMVFGTKNAFGVQSDYLVWYTATVDAEGDCTGIEIDQFIPYTR